MVLERAKEEIRDFFGKPATVVAANFARSYADHENRQQRFPGEARVLALQTHANETQSGIRYFTVESVITYGDEYTRWRFPGSRGSVSRALTIAAMDAGEAIGYMGQGRNVLTYIKTQHEEGIPSAENIMLEGLQEIDRFGTPLKTEDAYLTAAGPAKILGLSHGMRAQMTPFNFGQQRAFLLSVGNREWSEEELLTLEQELLAGLTELIEK